MQTSVQYLWRILNEVRLKGKKLYIGRLARRFLEDKDGEVDGIRIEMRCLKPKVGLGTVMEDTQNHLPDIGIFKIYDIIDGLGYFVSERK